MDIKGISELYDQGDLSSALTHAKTFVRDNPESNEGRSLLLQFYLFVGEVDKAISQLTILEKEYQDDLPSFMTLKVMAEMLKADNQRRAFFSSLTTMPALNEAHEAFLQPSFALMKGVADGSMTKDQAQELLADRPQPLFECKSGEETLTGELIEPDDLTAFALEVFVANQGYAWLPWQEIQSIEFFPYEKPIDLLYRKAMVHLLPQDGEEAQPMHVFVPTIYAGTSSTDTQASLARATDWDACPTTEIVTGIGQKCWLIGDDLVPILQIQSLQRRQVS
ncbi:type VI secretion system accessory protein TagJ [Marinomonas gallaica]|uniref:type VI secretion system accessory protein TagJ n=1 Tax=Marinomonas gallaica TaxID=1806667 RepID=UPI000832CB0A|nr:type VI secretion system accessory protein TagJ [Marinomonas gallaica]